MKRVSGYALITALLATAIIAVIALILVSATVRGLRDTRASGQRLTLLQKAENAAEFARLQVLQVYRCNQGQYTVGQFLAALENGQTLSCTHPPVHIKLGETRTLSLYPGTEIKWQLKGTHLESGFAWAEVVATAREGEKRQTVVERVSLSGEHIFDLALLAERTDCLYCHLRVHGDVGSLALLRPGWGSEYEGSDQAAAERADNFVGVTESTYTGHIRSEVWDDPVLNELAESYGVGSAGDEGGAIVRGSVYAWGQVSDDASGVYDASGNYLGRLGEASGAYSLINGALFTGNVHTDYKGPKLPGDRNGDGSPDFPPLEREVLESSANGRISGGRLIYAVDPDTTVDSLPTTSNTTEIEQRYQGSLILVGTPSNPIHLDGSVYVDGDVILKGVVTGHGAIYAGRNLYLAGDVTVANPPDKPGEGVCAGITDLDACAVANIQAGKDELRLAARQNIILGDYAELDENGNLYPSRHRQAELYFRNQFGFTDGEVHYYDKETGDELTPVTQGSSTVYLNPEGKVVPSSRVVSFVAEEGQPGDAYKVSFAPGRMKNGSFEQWMPDSVYRELLGTKEYSYRSWRAFYDGYTEAEVIQDLTASGVPRSVAEKIADLLQPEGGLTKCHDQDGDFDWNCGVQDFSADGISGRFQIWPDDDAKVVSLVIDNKMDQVAPVTKVDAFLYANSRIAGQSNQMAMAINGGLIARQIGILVPGRYRTWWMDDWMGPNASDKYNRYFSGDRDCLNPNNDYYVENTEDCALTVNYDYRLRNGGFGFELIRGLFGSVVQWRIADKASEHLN